MTTVEVDLVLEIGTLCYQLSIRGCSTSMADAIDAPPPSVGYEDASIHTYAIGRV